MPEPSNPSVSKDHVQSHSGARSISDHPLWHRCCAQEHSSKFSFEERVNVPAKEEARARWAREPKNFLDEIVVYESYDWKVKTINSVVHLSPQCVFIAI